MSQIYRSTSSGPSPPNVPTSFPTDDGTAVPAANVLNVLARDTTVSDDDGIRTNADPDNSNNLFVELTNRLFGTASSVNAANADIITFSLGAVAAVYRFEFHVCGRDTATGDGVGYTIFGSARTTGAAATIISTPFNDNDEDASLIAATMNLIASGNNVILRAVGVAGQTISYKAVGNYISI